MSKKAKKWIAAIISAIVAILVGASITISIVNGEPTITIKYAETNVPTIIETENGQIEVIDAPTVESIDAELVTPKDECPKDSTECAKGAGYLPYLDITSPITVYNSVINQCIDFDGAWGSQCFDLMAYFHYVYTGRWLSANGTGAAYGIWDARDYNNQGNEYELIYDATQIKTGDWVVFHNGIYGHVGMAVGNYNNGYVALLGTNQGGSGCPGGGSVANVINMSLNSFSGAFRPRIWIQPEPKPQPEPTSPTTYIYKKGDTFGQVLLDLGLSDGTDLWGQNGKVNLYNEVLYKQGILDYYNGKYWNNIPIGTEINLEIK